MGKTGVRETVLRDQVRLVPERVRTSHGGGENLGPIKNEGRFEIRFLHQRQASKLPQKEEAEKP